MKSSSIFIWPFKSPNLISFLSIFAGTSLTRGLPAFASIISSPDKTFRTGFMHLKSYLVFSLMPWSHNISRAIKKEEKYYFFDWTWAGSPGAQFENAVAVSLLRLVCRWNEVGSGDFELRYISNRSKTGQSKQNPLNIRKPQDQRGG